MIAQRESYDERQYGESTKAYAAFCEYRDMGATRSLVRVGQKLGKSEALIARWSSHWRWVLRVTIWDAEQDALKRQAQQEEAEAMGRRHAQQAQAAIEVMMQPVYAFENLISQEDTGEAIRQRLERMDPLELIAAARKCARMLPLLASLEREARSGHTSTFKVDISGNVRALAEQLGLDPEIALKQAKEIVRAVDGDDES